MRRRRGGRRASADGRRLTAPARLRRYPRDLPRAECATLLHRDNGDPHAARRPAHRPARRLVRSAARRARAHHRLGAEGASASTGSGGWSSPGNPLKPDAPADLVAAAGGGAGDHAAPAGGGDRPRGAARHALHRGDAEGAQARYPGVRFVWLMGADNLAGFHRWDRWPEIMATVPVGVLARPGQQLRAGLSPAARRFARWRVPQAQARGPALPRAAGLGAGQRADARPLLERAARARGAGGAEPAPVIASAAACWPAAAAWLAAPALRPVRGGPGAEPLAAILAASGLGGRDRLRRGRPRHRRAARGAPSRRRPAAGLGRQDRDRALRARRARARTTASAPRSAAPGRSRAGCCAATWCSPAAAIRCSTPTRSADWCAALSARGLGAVDGAAPRRRRGAAGGRGDRRAASRRTPATTRRSRG